MRYFVGVDLGATKIKAVVGTEDGTIVGRDRRPTPQGPAGIAVTEGVLDTVRTACDDAAVAPERVVALAIGSFGPFDLAEGMIVNPANLPDVIDRIPLVGPLSALVDSDNVYLHNDTTAGVIGERYHADRNPDDMVYVTFSTGIGAGITVDGTVLAGWDGNAGEVGHFTVDPAGRLECGCGRDGHWEAYASGSGIPRYTRYLADECDLREDTSLDLAADEFTAKDVFEAPHDDPLVSTVLDRVGTWNTIGIANIVHAYAPLVISVGGSVALNNEAAVLDPIREQIDGAVMSNVPEIRLTTHGDDVVVVGALASAMTSGTGDRTVGPI